MKILFLFGPNLNLLGSREPDVYGTMSWSELLEHISRVCADRGVEPSFFQSNHEGALIDAVQAAAATADAIVINAGGYSHTSIALMDALKAVALPTVEVHLSDPRQRESFRHISYTGLACLDTFSGHGAGGYDLAVDCLLTHFVSS